MAQPAVLVVFGQINARHHADGRADESGYQHHQKRAENRIGNAARLVGRGRHGGKGLQAQAAQPQPDGVQQNPQQPENAKRHGQHRQAEHDAIDQFASRKFGRAVVVGGSGVAGHDGRPSFLRRRRSNSLDRVNTTKVMMNSTKPK